MFQSVTCRTAGFNAVDIASLGEVTLTLIIFLIFIGASPGSCGGGVKTITLVLLATFTLSRVRRKKRVNIFKKSVPYETVTRSVSLVLISIRTSLLLQGVDDMRLLKGIRMDVNKKVIRLLAGKAKKREYL